MAVILNSKDLQTLDEQFATESVVWQPLTMGAKKLTANDFVGVNEVRIDKFDGFGQEAYVRNSDNARKKINVTKETRKLLYELWMGYDLDVLDQSENGIYNISAVVEQHIRTVAIPTKDRNAIGRLISNSDKLVTETITVTNALTSYDAAEQYMIDNEITGNKIMFVSSDYYKALKQNDSVQRKLDVGNMTINGINRRVANLDGETPIIIVPASRLSADSKKKINFITLPMEVALAIEKFNDVNLVPASQDRDGYRDTIKGLNYYDLLVLDNAKKGIYVSYVAIP